MGLRSRGICPTSFIYVFNVVTKSAKALGRSEKALKKVAHTLTGGEARCFPSTLLIAHETGEGARKNVPCCCCEAMRVFSSGYICTYTVSFFFCHSNCFGLEVQRFSGWGGVATLSIYRNPIHIPRQFASMLQTCFTTSEWIPFSNFDDAKIMGTPFRARRTNTSTIT